MRSSKCSKEYIFRDVLGIFSSGDLQLAARADQAIKDQKTRARRERAREARGQTAQTKGWLTTLKIHAAIVWVANRLAGIEVCSATPGRTPSKFQDQSAACVDLIGGIMEISTEKARSNKRERTFLVDVLVFSSRLTRHSFIG